MDIEGVGESLVVGIMILNGQKCASHAETIFPCPGATVSLVIKPYCFY